MVILRAPEKIVCGKVPVSWGMDEEAVELWWCAGTMGKGEEDRDLLLICSGANEVIYSADEIVYNF
jgi:hypothetical protein